MAFAFVAPMVSLIASVAAVLVVFGGTGLAAVRASRPT